MGLLGWLISLAVVVKLYSNYQLCQLIISVELTNIGFICYFVHNDRRRFMEKYYYVSSYYDMIMLVCNSRGYNTRVKLIATW